MAACGVTAATGGATGALAAGAVGGGGLTAASGARRGAFGSVRTEFERGAVRFTGDGAVATAVPPF